MYPSLNRSRLETPGRFVSEPVSTRIATFVAVAVERVLEWQERSTQRHRLMGLDDRMLRDIGVSRSDVAHEYYKRPWRI